MDFIGNKKVVNYFCKSLYRGIVNHAYIFSGPQGVGKTTFAKMFAQAVIGGSNINLDADFQNKEAMLDLLLIEPEIVEVKDVIKQRDITIESIRNAQQSLSLFPYHGKYKVLIVRDAHRMNNSAQNALLKLLEEPNQTSVLILVTSEPDRILPTVQSRCEKIDFSLVSQAEIEAAFGDKKEFVSDLGVLAMGRPGIARNMLNDKNELEMRRQSGQQLRRLRAGTIGEKLQMAEDFSKNIRKTIGVFNIWIWLLRADALSCNDEVARDEIYRVIERIQKSMIPLKSTNANGKLMLEVLFLEI